MDYNYYYRAAGSGDDWHDDPTNYDFADWQGTAGFDANGGEANPLFVDAANNDFNLTFPSPCVNSGIVVGLTQDKDGKLVPVGNAPDIGAYESIFVDTSITAIDVLTVVDVIT